MSNLEKQPANKVTEKQLDAYVDRRNCSYEEAYNHFNVTPDQIEIDGNIDDDRPHLDVEKKSYVGASTNLIELDTDLIRLLGPSGLYPKARKLASFAIKLEKMLDNNPKSDYVVYNGKEYNYTDVTGLVEASLKYREEGNEIFLDVTGMNTLADELIKVGASEVDVRNAMRQVVADFNAKHVDVDSNTNKEYLQVLKNNVKVLKKQAKRAS